MYFGLQFLLCIGGTLEEREIGKIFFLLKSQLREGMQKVAFEDVDRVVIAYKLVCSIGTEKAATTEQTQEPPNFLQRLIKKIFEKNVADQIRILYGGSVKPANVDELMS